LEPSLHWSCNADLGVKIHAPAGRLPTADKPQLLVFRSLQSDFDVRFFWLMDAKQTWPLVSMRQSTTPTTKIGHAGRLRKLEVVKH
jgi:hypothetical protein